MAHSYTKNGLKNWSNGENDLYGELNITEIKLTFNICTTFEGFSDFTFFYVRPIFLAS